MREQQMEVKLDRKNTSFKELIDIIDTVGGYPVVARDFDGTLLTIIYKETEESTCCVLLEPGTDETGTIKTYYYEDGRVEQICMNQQ